MDSSPRIPGIGSPVTIFPRPEKFSVEKILRDPENVFTTTPQNVMKYAEFMHKVGAMKEMPARWSDMFFPEIHGKPGS